MIDDRRLAELMDMATNEDKQALMAMMKTMSREDIIYFKGYVAGYSEAVMHLQSANSQGFPNDEVGLEYPISGTEPDMEES